MKDGPVGPTLLRVLAAGALFLAPARHPYAYYVGLRWFVCIVAGYSALELFRRGLSTRAWWLVGVSVLVNPMAPIYLGRDTWAVIDIAAGVLLLSAAVSLWNRQSPLVSETLAAPADAQRRPARHERA